MLSDMIENMSLLSTKLISCERMFSWFSCLGNSVLSLSVSFSMSLYLSLSLYLSVSLTSFHPPGSSLMVYFLENVKKYLNSILVLNFDQWSLIIVVCRYVYKCMCTCMYLYVLVCTCMYLYVLVYSCTCT